MLGNPDSIQLQRKRRIRLIIAIGLVFFTSFSIAFMMYYRIYVRGIEFQRAVAQLPTGQYYMQDVVPFSWDSIFSFDSFTSVETMENATGIRSSYFFESQTEGIRQYYFIEEEAVVCWLYGSFEDLGFLLDLGGEPLFYEEEAVFTVEETVHRYVSMRKSRGG